MPWGWGVVSSAGRACVQGWRSWRRCPPYSLRSASHPPTHRTTNGVEFPPIVALSSPTSSPRPLLSSPPSCGFFRSLIASVRTRHSLRGHSLHSVVFFAFYFQPIHSFALCLLHGSTASTTLVINIKPKDNPSHPVALHNITNSPTPRVLRTFALGPSRSNRPHLGTSLDRLRHSSIGVRPGFVCRPTQSFLGTVHASPPPDHTVKMDLATMQDNMSSSTPSPTASGTPGTVTSASRRPPRKSTLTQQQKNQKRQRATQDQLVLLEIEFNKNPTPTNAVRERIAQEINMTERSVQIWFQNRFVVTHDTTRREKKTDGEQRRRAKIKLLAKKSIETGEDCDAIPESYRNYLAQQAFESGKPLARNFLTHTGGSMGSYGNSNPNMLIGAENSSPQKVGM